MASSDLGNQTQFQTGPHAAAVHAQSMKIKSAPFGTSSLVRLEHSVSL